MHYLLNRESDRNLGDKVVVPIFALAQGIFAAWGIQTGWALSSGTVLALR